MRSEKKKANFHTDGPCTCRRCTVEPDGADNDVNDVAEFFPESIYLWALGGKVKTSDDDVVLSDMVIGWLTLAVRRE